MRVAVKPPEYLPRLSYVALMQAVDVFVIADTYQYSRQSWQNRSRIRTPQGAHWISVPLLGRQHGNPIHKTQIDNRTHWQSKHFRSLTFNYRQTPYFGYIEEELQQLYMDEWEWLGDLACQSVNIVHGMYQAGCKIEIASALNGSPASLDKILEVTGATELVIDHPAEVLGDMSGIEVKVLGFKETQYRQHFEGYEPETTALDLLCNYGPEAPALVRAGAVVQ